MPVATHAHLNPHSQSRFQGPQTSHRQASSRAFPPDSCAALDRIVHVVSDNTAQVSGLAAFFSSHSIKINAVRSVCEIIRNVRPDQTACVILDLNLPDSNGLEVQSRLADIGGPPVIFVTTHGDQIGRAHV